MFQFIQAFSNAFKSAISTGLSNIPQPEGHPPGSIPVSTMIDSIRAIDPHNVIAQNPSSVMPHLAPSWTLAQLQAAFQNSQLPANASPIDTFEAGAIWAAGLSYADVTSRIVDNVNSALTAHTTNLAAQVAAQVAATAVGQVVAGAATGGQEGAAQAVESIAETAGTVLAQTATTAATNAVTSASTATPTGTTAEVVGAAADIAEGYATGGQAGAIAAGAIDGLKALAGHFLHPSQPADKG